MNADPLLELAAYRRALADWLDAEAAALGELRGGEGTFEERLARVRALQLRLFDDGWARYGWSAEAGGLGGGTRHRAVMYEELARRGYPPRTALEHLEILAPVLERRLAAPVRSEVLPALISGRKLLCQGFSETEAGSDLASLRTTAAPRGDGFELSGAKLWTSWVEWADYCVVLARTGTREERHRGLTAFLVDMDAPGVTSAAIQQANGEDELGELHLSEVFVPGERVIGAVGDGWRCAMEVLAAERGLFGWQRHLPLVARLETSARVQPPSEQTTAAVLDMFALRCRSARSLAAIDAGWEPGPEAAVNKILLADGEQAVYDALEAGSEVGFTLGLGSGAELRDDYLFSRAVTVYGGTRQIQLDIIARQVLGL